MNLPTKTGWYWVLHDIGITQVRCPCMVSVIDKNWTYTLAEGKFKEGDVLICSYWDSYTEPLKWNPELFHKQHVKWDPKTHIAWSGPIKEAEEFVGVRTGKTIKWTESFGDEL